ncbi:MAG: secondary thiamine-phosphate synthase enzyme YjbQ [Bacillota bacterium]|jgi:secondary thiamine-phosphate synthase enzyme|nr:secondary thiamine-phosphate synthase enzyme YjbQ [Bacillota bacterium]NLU54245.1 YjbQ family protein [Bacillota bacterium]HOA91324.1 secondary thiamine-phosphate synthase enzyme YjbQ [Bacillota bacterium]HOJ46441.1 secondary thiamine-phosphate synthase enzyme YjbQ [Bacillota bacterium]HOL13420.1 secondary thiamine-phosphate synthase enzyme YjbQ [Bacillota bacterium]
MACFQDDLTVATKHRREIVLITDRVEDIVKKSGVESGICLVFAKHTTCAVTINEAADPTVRQDMLAAFEFISPYLKEYRHMEGNSPAHVLTSLVGPSEVIPVRDGKLALGTWQGIYLCEFDGPRTRRVCVQVLG